MTYRIFCALAAFATAITVPAKADDVEVPSYISTHCVLCPKGGETTLSFGVVLTDFLIRHGYLEDRN